MIEAPPLMLIRGAEPKVPDMFWIDNPGTRPSNMRDTSAIPSSLISSIFTDVAAPVYTLLRIF